MAEVTAAMVKELRERTGAGMVDCKKALVETAGDVNKSIEWLREKGLATAAKKSGRIASDGIVHVLLSGDGKKGVVIEVNCETDFVAKNAEFRTLVEEISVQALNSSANSAEELLEEKWHLDNAQTVKDVIISKIAVIGENISLRRFERLVKDTPGMFATYIHGGGKIAVLLDIVSEKTSGLVAEAGKNIAMQIAALFPKYVAVSDIPQDFIEKEREILKAQALNEGKPLAAVDKIVEGRLGKQLKEICVLEQPYVKNNDITVKQYFEEVSREVGCEVIAKKFVCFERGEGIEKKEDNFAEEVSKML